MEAPTAMEPSATPRIRCWHQHRRISEGSTCWLALPLLPYVGGMMVDWAKKRAWEQLPVPLALLIATGLLLCYVKWPLWPQKTLAESEDFREGRAMTPAQETILRFLDKTVLAWMRNDLDRAMEKEAHLLAALGLASYTEFLGGLLNGKLGRRHCTRECFKAGFEALGTPYISAFAADPDIYSWLRCGLVHQYFPKDKSAIDLGSDEPCAVVEVGGQKRCLLNPYRRDFFATVKQCREKVAAGDAALLQTFEEGLRRIGLPFP